MAILNKAMENWSINQHKTLLVLDPLENTTVLAVLAVDAAS